MSQKRIIINSPRRQNFNSHINCNGTLMRQIRQPSGNVWNTHHKTHIIIIIIIIIVITIIIIIIISFMQGIYTYIPETNYVPREYSVAAILLLFMVLISLISVLNLLYFYISTFRSMCAVHNMSVFCSSLTSWFPGMLFTYFLNDFGIVPVAPIITDITFVFTFHMRCISIVRSLYFRNFSASFLITFLSPEIATSINIHVAFPLSRFITSGLLLETVLSFCICWFHNMVTLPPWLVSTDFGTCSYQSFCPIVPLFPCICWSIVVDILLLLLLLLLMCWWSSNDSMEVNWQVSTKFDMIKLIQICRIVLIATVHCQLLYLRTQTASFASHLLNSWNAW